MSENPSGKAAVFLDRDGTINRHLEGYISEPENLQLLDGVGQSLRRLRAAGYLLVLITNQAGLGKGLMDEKDLRKIHNHLEDLLTQEGVKLDAIYFCGYHPEATVEKYLQQSGHRKPEPGMVLEAAEDLNIDLSKSWMIGDNPGDVEAGKQAGCRTVLLTEPEETSEQPSEPKNSEHADFTAKSILEAAEVIIEQDIGQASGEQAGAKPKLRAKPTQLDSRRLLSDILRELRHQRIAPHHREFSVSKMLAGMLQCVVLMCLVLGYVAFSNWSGNALFACLMTGLILQMMVVALLLMGRSG